MSTLQRDGHVARAGPAALHGGCGLLGSRPQEGPSAATLCCPQTHMLAATLTPCQHLQTHSQPSVDPPPLPPPPAARSLHINELQSIPPELGNLVQLEALSLHSNHLTEFPPQLSTLTGLVRLSLYQNKLRSLPPEVGALTALQVRRGWGLRFAWMWGKPCMLHEWGSVCWCRVVGLECGE